MDTWQKLQKKAAHSSLDIFAPLQKLLYKDEDDAMEPSFEWELIEVELLKLKEQWNSANLRRMLIKHLKIIQGRPALRELYQFLAS